MNDAMRRLETLLVIGPRFAACARHALIHGAAGIVVPDAPGQPPLVMGFAIRGGRVVKLHLNGDPAKTAQAMAAVAVADRSAASRGSATNS